MLAFVTTACTKKTNDYVIMLKNHEKALHVNAAGRVTAAHMSLARKLLIKIIQLINEIFIYQYQEKLLIN